MHNTSVCLDTLATNTRVGACGEIRASNIDNLYLLRSMILTARDYCERAIEATRRDN